MKERPIIFSAPMARAIRDGRKTQTRRIVKPQPLRNPNGFGLEWHGGRALLRAGYGGGYVHSDMESVERAMLACCPYGVPGDRLWVRESGWERPARTKKMLRQGADTWHLYYYDADGLSDQDRADFKAWGFVRRRLIHMPRWASRISLEIEAVRVQRLQDISEYDAIAEGVSGWAKDERCETARDGFRVLWESIHGPGAWGANPWVWAITFRRVQA